MVKLNQALTLPLHSFIPSFLHSFIPLLSNPFSLTLAPMITVIIATNRKDSASGRVGREIEQRALASGKTIQVWDFNDLPANIAFGETYGNRSDAFQQAIDQFIAPIQQLVFVVPEYNGSFPGILKLVIDAIPQKYGKTRWPLSWACHPVLRETSAAKSILPGFSTTLKCTRITLNPH